MEKKNRNNESEVNQGFQISQDERVKLQITGKIVNAANCNRPGGFLWGSNGNSSCTC